MVNLMIRNLDEATKTNLRLQAARSGCSMEEEARRILRQAVSPATTTNNLGACLHRRFAALGGVELEPAALADRPCRISPKRQANDPGNLRCDCVPFRESVWQLA